MKKTITFVTVVVLCSGILLAGAATADESVDLDDLEGEGTEDDPYVITTVEELQAIEQDLDAHYVLGNDIDASETEEWNDRQGFDPIGDNEARAEDPFTGHFDGDDHTVSGLVVDRPTEPYAAPFGAVTGTVENVHFADVDVTGGDIYIGGAVGENEGEVRSVTVSGEVVGAERRVGGLVGQNAEGFIEKSMADVDVQGVGSGVGGLVGSNRGDIHTSYFAGAVEGEDNVGGIVGFNSGKLRSSYNTGDVVGENERAGGLIGWFSGSISDSYVASSVDGDGESLGAAIGEEDARGTAAPRTVENLYFDQSVTALDATGDGSQFGTGVSNEELTGPDALDNLGFEARDDWAVTDGYPVLDWQVEDVSLRVGQSSIGEGETTSVTVELTLNDGSTKTATQAATYDIIEAVADVSDGTLEANSVGETEFTASVAGQSDSVTIEVLEPPNIELADTSLEADAVVAGTTVEATATYENTGGPGSETAKVTVDGTSVSSTVVTVDADSEATQSLTWTAEEDGTVELDGDTLGALSVYDPGTVDLESISVPDEAAAGSAYDIELELSNEADESVTETVAVQVADGESTTEAVEVPADGSTTSISVSHDEQGTATNIVEVQDTTETAPTEIVEAAEFVVEDVDAPEAVTEGDTATVSATVTNVGGGMDEATITLTVDDQTVDETTVELDAGASETVEFQPTLADEGEVSLAFESPDDTAEMDFSVTATDASDEADPDSTADDDAGTADDSVPGFTIGVAAVALLLGSALLARRR